MVYSRNSSISNSRIMKSFLKNLIIFAFPFAIYLIVIVSIDPFNYLGFSKIIDEKYKVEISQNVEQHLYRLIRYENSPKRNVSLGDSRANSLHYALNQDQWGNLSFGGASLKETVQAFWWTVDNFELDTILIAVNFNNYNKYNKRFWVEETLKRKKNFFSYAFCKYAFRSSFLILKDILSTKEVEINKTSLNKEGFWDAKLSMLPRKYFEQYAYPDIYYDDLQRIASYCEENGIKLIMWIPPSVVDFQKAVEKYNLGQEEERFRSDLRSIAELYDFNFINVITENRDNFSDPLHVTFDVAVLIRKEIFEDNPEVAKYSRPD